MLLEENSTTFGLIFKTTHINHFSSSWFSSSNSDIDISQNIVFVLPNIEFICLSKTIYGFVEVGKLTCRVDVIHKCEWQNRFYDFLIICTWHLLFAGVPSIRPCSPHSSCNDNNNCASETKKLNVLYDIRLNMFPINKLEKCMYAMFLAGLCVT